MDALIAKRLDATSSFYDAELYNKLAKLGWDYRTAGTSILEYYLSNFDIASDMVNCMATIDPKTFDKVDRGDPQNFIHPMTATEMWTLATFVSQILFGGETSRKVEPRNPDDEAKADVVNELLAWNDNQQPTYNQGFYWCLDAIAKNRGVMYDHWQKLMEVVLEPVEYELPWEPPIDPETGKVAKDPETGKKYRKPADFEGGKHVRFRKVRKPVGGFVKIDNISPYDFICDPTLPISRFQEGRFAGHRVVLPWIELKRRSELPTDDYEYVLPKVVEKLKNSMARRGIPSTPSGNQSSTSRSAYERTRRQQPVVTTTGSDKINKEDGGVIECWCLQITAKPSVYGIFPEDEEDEKIELLLAGETDLLSVNIVTNRHDQYPYAIGEGRPDPHAQFGPSWALIIRGPQSYVDYLKDRHHDSLARTSGNIFLGNPKYVDFEKFTDPKKDGMLIPVTEEGEGKPMDQILKQIPVVDLTARFHEEMILWQNTAEQATGAHAVMQGSKEEGDPTATEFVGTQQMAQGRLSTIARLLSASALVPQTQRIISNLQQFLPVEMIIRVTGENDAFDPDRPPEKFMEVIRDISLLEDGTGVDEEGNPIPRDPRLDDPNTHDIQSAGFDITVHDGSLPGTDAKKVAALSRAVEAWSSGNPAFAQIFDPSIPGAIDPKRLFYKLLRASGFPIGDLAVTREEALKNQQERMMAQGGGLGMPAPAPGAPPGPSAPPDASGMPSAAVIPPTPTAAPPGPSPLTA